jgi:methylase of polypeptide subunit release factors
MTTLGPGFFTVELECFEPVHGRCKSCKDLVWVDLGGGTGQNVETMAAFCDLSLFKKVYVVDICGPLCEIAREKVAKHGWTNVEVVEADVCDYKPDETYATLVTFYYSLSSNSLLNHVAHLFLMQGLVSDPTLSKHFRRS